MDRKTVAQVLRGAADIIDKDGLAKKTYGRRGEPRCALGAMCGALSLTARNPAELPSGLFIVWGKAESAFADYLDGPIIAQWNDVPEREPWEVIDALRNCADKIEGEAGSA